MPLISRRFEDPCADPRAVPCMVQDPPDGALQASCRADARGRLSNGEAVTLYDTSGPYTDPGVDIDVRAACRLCARLDRIACRHRAYAGRARRALDDGAKDEAARAWRQLRDEAAPLQRTPRRAKAGSNITQMHYAKRGIVTPEMEFVAIRENGRREWMARVPGRS